MARTLNPSSESVALAFVKAVPGIQANKVATVLPSDKAAWQDTGFVQVRTVGGSPNRHVPQAQPVLAIDCWANNGDSKQPAWGKANDLAERIRREIQDNLEFFGQAVDPGPNYKTARILSAWLVTEPRRIEGDENGYARYTFDLEIVWVVTADG